MTKPFNLEAALAGAPVVTRDGRKVTQLFKFDVKHDIFSLYGVINDEVRRWQFNGLNCDKTMDLFMSPVKKQYWTFSFRYKEEGRVLYDELFENKEDMHVEASHYINDNGIDLQIHMIEVAE